MLPVKTASNKPHRLCNCASSLYLWLIVADTKYADKHKLFSYFVGRPPWGPCLGPSLLSFIRGRLFLFKQNLHITVHQTMILCCHFYLPQRIEFAYPQVKKSRQIIKTSCISYICLDLSILVTMQCPILSHDTVSLQLNKPCASDS